MVIGSRIVKALKGTGSGYWMTLPALLAIVAIVAYPLAFATYYSFRRVLPNLAGEFIGLENYSRMLEDPDFAEALKTTLVFTAASGASPFWPVLVWRSCSRIWRSTTSGESAYLWAFRRIGDNHASVAH